MSLAPAAGCCLERLLSLRAYPRRPAARVAVVPVRGLAWSTELARSGACDARRQAAGAWIWWAPLQLVVLDPPGRARRWIVSGSGAHGASALASASNDCMRARAGRAGPALRWRGISPRQRHGARSWPLLATARTTELHAPDLPPPGPPGEIDFELVQRDRGQATRRPYELLVIKYQRRIERLIGRMVRDINLIEDIAQETFIRAYRRSQQFRGEAQFYTWLYRIAVNTAKKALVDLEAGAGRLRERPAAFFRGRR